MGRCSDYRHRHAYVRECVRLNAGKRRRDIEWLPSTCAYRLRAEGKHAARTGIIW